MAGHYQPRDKTNELRTVEQRENELLQIEQYRDLVDLIELKTREGHSAFDTLQLTSKLLTKNPEYYTIWNVRRQLLISGLFSSSSDPSSQSTQSHNTSQIGTISPSSANSSSSISTSPRASKTILRDRSHPILGRNGTTVESDLDLIKEDLDFLVPLLKQWPKCYWIWNYRTWLLQQASLRLDVGTARSLWERELALCKMMLVKDRRNFHGWGYRRIVVQNLESEQLGGKSMVEDEFAYTTKMIGADLSNFSAWHSRSVLIPQLLRERKASDSSRKDFLHEEFDIIRNALWTAWTDQSPWFYYQFLMDTLIRTSLQDAIAPSLSTAERIDYVDRQLIELRELLEGAEDCKWIYNALVEYTLAACRLKGREATPLEAADLRLWVSLLRKLDPLRSGRWDDVDRTLLSL